MGTFQGLQILRSRLCLIAKTDDCDGVCQATGLVHDYALADLAAVARIVGIAQDTVNDYLRRVRLKYAAADRPAPTKTELFMRAQEDGYLPGPTDPKQLET